MFKGQTLWAILHAGGFTMYILLFSSVLSFAVIIERVMYYRRKSKTKRQDFMRELRGVLERGYIAKALDIIDKTDTPFARVAHSGLILHDHNEKIISEAMEREITIETVKLERYTSIVGTIGSTAVYIGLFGTVLGIIRAFRDIAVSGAGGINVVISGISEALVCTAAGLLVAIPAVITYNFFIRKIDNFVVDMELCASELVELLCVKQK
jgi:biopolymer transport protein ExbB/TolQ